MRSRIETGGYGPLNNIESCYRFMVGICMLLILYIIVKNYIIDFEFEGFLSHKTGVKHRLNLTVWLNVVYVHIGFACIAMAVGLLNFSYRIYHNRRRLHRINGYIYVVSVFIVVLTSGYLAPHATGGKITSIGFNVLNIIWLYVTTVAMIHIKKKRIIQHRNWMVRSYVFCYTNLTIHLVTALLNQGFGYEYVSSYTIGVYASIVLLLTISELVIRKISDERLIGRATHIS
ncbi:DUF2306 domain-containing protein [Paenibacillus turpanensis]|uniref:DUF2306 domain-containing protein n=1 Tax=Paenibacillus turpanensis TaxID=2689078 RepID=UPI001FB7F8BD|nr:DUF2306 domain-containing protein [Paenibacillus turpanensis]